MTEVTQDTQTQKTTRAGRAMTVCIGRWTKGEDGKPVFTVLKDLGTSVTDKQIRDAIVELGVGKYDVLSYRSVERQYAQKVVNQFV